MSKLLSKLLGLAKEDARASEGDRSRSKKSGQQRADYPGVGRAAPPQGCGGERAKQPWPAHPARQPPPAGQRHGPIPLEEASSRLNDRRAAGLYGRHPAAGGAAPARPAVLTMLGESPSTASAPSMAEQRPAGGARSSSLPRPLGGTPQQPAEAGSGPGAPVSTPDPAVPPTLRRVSSQPQTAAPGQQSSDGYLHSSSGATGATSAEAPDTGARSSLHLSRSMSAASSGTSSDAAAAQLPAVPGGDKAEAAATSALQRQRQQQQEGQQAAAAAPVSLAAALAAAGDDDDDAVLGQALPAGPLHTPGNGVSLLTFQLRGPSAATSLASSRETSVRGGAARSREHSVRSIGGRPVGGLTLALSRENSVKAGQASASREQSTHGGALSRELSARGGALSREASTRGGALSREASARGYQGPDFFDPDRPDKFAFRSMVSLFGPGRGSTDWMGAPTGPQLADMLDACDAQAQPAAALDPFAPAAIPGAQRGSGSRPASCRPSYSIPEDEREGLLELQPQDVGSWAERVTKFEHKKAPAAPAEPAAGRAAGLDPLLLTAALEALAATNPACTGGCQGGCDGGNCKMLVGDSDLATATTGAQGSGEPPRLRLSGGSWSTGGRPSSGSAGGPPAAVVALSSSWDVADGAGVVGLRDVLAMPHLGGSAPTCGAAGSPRPSAHGSAPQRPGSQPLPGQLTAGDTEWNRDFMRRWRAVKKRAYLQALGLRALWRVNSPSDRHEPLELLTNDLPQYDNGMRRAWSVSRLAAQREQEDKAARRAGASSTARPMPRRPSYGSLHKDPSLGTLLLGEVAEVC